MHIAPPIRDECATGDTRFSAHFKCGIAFFIFVKAGAKRSPKGCLDKKLKKVVQLKDVRKASELIIVYERFLFKKAFQYRNKFFILKLLLLKYTLIDKIENQLKFYTHETFYETD